MPLDECDLLVFAPLDNSGCYDRKLWRNEFSSLDFAIGAIAIARQPQTYNDKQLLAGPAAQHSGPCKPCGRKMMSKVWFVVLLGRQARASWDVACQYRCPQGTELRPVVDVEP